MDALDIFLAIYRQFFSVSSLHRWTQRNHLRLLVIILPSLTIQLKWYVHEDAPCQNDVQWKTACLASPSFSYIRIQSILQHGWSSVTYSPRMNSVRYIHRLWNLVVYLQLDIETHCDDSLISPFILLTWVRYMTKYNLLGYNNIAIKVLKL